MRKIDFDDLWKNHLFDYKDGDLLVIDDITRLQLSDYLHTHAGLRDDSLLPAGYHASLYR